MAFNATITAAVFVVGKGEGVRVAKQIALQSDQRDFYGFLSQAASANVFTSALGH